MQVFVEKKCGGSHRAPNGIRSGGGRCTVAEHQLQHDSYCAFSIFSPNFYKQKCRGLRDNLYLCRTRRVVKIKIFGKLNSKQF